MKIRDYDKVTNIKDLTNEGIILPPKFECLRNSTLIHNGKSYYIKPASEYEMINELIGSYLSKQIGLDSVEYSLGYSDEDIYAMSELFFQKDYNYYSFNDLLVNEYSDWLIKVEHYVHEYGNALYLLNYDMFIAMLKLIAIDLRMGQYDRRSNMMFKDKSGVFEFAPMYDFGASYPNYTYRKYLNEYINNFVIIEKDKEFLKQFSKDFPSFMDFVEIIRSIKMSDVLDEIQSENGIKLSDHEIKHYVYKDNEHNNVLKMI